ncbi:MAG: FAD binding domain-containing protein [Candidatus Dormiibacterota bacterium]
MKLPAFEIHRPRTVAETSLMLADLGSDASVYCGGTELLLAMQLGLANYPHLVDIKGLPELHGIERRSNGVWIGGTTRHHEIETSPEVRTTLPEMATMISHVANPRVRSVGTIGGNLCFGDPHSDPATFLIAANAEVVCRIRGEQVRVAASEFGSDAYETVLGHEDLLLGVEIPSLPSGAGMSHLRMKLHERPTVTVSAVVQLKNGIVSDARVAIGCIGPVAARSDVADELLGKSVTVFDDAARACAHGAAAAAQPMPGAESAEYRAHMVEVLVFRALRAAFERAQN